MCDRHTAESILDSFKPKESQSAPARPERRVVIEHSYIGLVIPLLFLSIGVVIGILING